MTPLPPDEDDDLVNRRFALAQGADEAARIEARRLRRQNRELMERFAALHSGFSQSQRDARRAALNLLEDAEEARRAEQHETAERLRADAALRASEERLRLLFLSMSEGFMLKEAVLDGAGKVVDYRIIECNPALAVQTGLRNPVGRTLRELMPGLEPFWLERCERVRVTGEPVQFEAFCGPLGRWLSVSVARLAGAAKHRLATVVTNITARRQAEAALRESEERHRIALEAAGMGTWDFTLATDQVIWDDGCCRLFGLAPDCQAQTGESFLGFVHPDDRARVRAAMETMSKAEVFREEFRVVRADGIARWLSSFGQITQWHEGRAARATGTIFDVTKRHESEEKLAAAQEQLRLIVESALEHAIISLDRDCRVTSWNPGAERMFGYAAAEMVGGSLDPIFMPEDRRSGFLAGEAQRALATGRAGGERWHLRRDGTRLWTNCTMLPMNARSGGEPVGFVKILRDETANLEARQELEQTSLFLRDALRDTERARAETEAAGQAKDHFLAVLSHELRTPLMPIQMALGMLSRRQDLPAPVRSAHDMITRNVELEAHFIDDMLDMTRIVRGKMEIVREPMDLHEAARRAVEVSLPDLEAKRQQITLALEASDHHLSGDFARLQQAMWNLLKNASKFTPEGGEIGLRTRNEPAERRIVVEVTDSGIGMEPEVLERIFNPFEQADLSITQQFGGLGLGLAIAKGTVEAHGGALRASSAGRGQGAAFTMGLPL